MVCTVCGEPITPNPNEYVQFAVHDVKFFFHDRYEDDCWDLYKLASDMMRPMQMSGGNA